LTLPKSTFSELNGFYAGFMSGSADQGLAVFVFRNGVIVGADFAGTTFDGSIHEKNADGGLVCSMRVSLPPNGTTVQGVEIGPDGITYEIEFTLPADFEQRSFFNVATPLGSVNVKLQKVRELGAING
jgi:hypothetical protein